MVLGWKKEYQDPKEVCVKGDHKQLAKLRLNDIACEDLQVCYLTCVSKNYPECLKILLRSRNREWGFRERELFFYKKGKTKGSFFEIACTLGHIKILEAALEYFEEGLITSFGMEALASTALSDKGNSTLGWLLQFPSIKKSIVNSLQHLDRTLVVISDGVEKSLHKELDRVGNHKYPVAGRYRAIYENVVAIAAYNGFDKHLDVLFSVPAIYESSEEVIRLVLSQFYADLFSCVKERRAEYHHRMLMLRSRKDVKRIESIVDDYRVVKTQSGERLYSKARLAICILEGCVKDDLELIKDVLRDKRNLEILSTGHGVEYIVYGLKYALIHNRNEMVLFLFQYKWVRDGILKEAAIERINPFGDILEEEVVKALEDKFEVLTGKIVPLICLYGSKEVFICIISLWRDSRPTLWLACKLLSGNNQPEKLEYVLSIFDAKKEEKNKLYFEDKNGVTAFQNACGNGSTAVLELAKKNFEGKLLEAYIVGVLSNHPDQSVCIFNTSLGYKTLLWMLKNYPNVRKSVVKKCGSLGKDARYVNPIVIAMLAGQFFILKILLEIVNNKKQKKDALKKGLSLMREACKGESIRNGIGRMSKRIAMLITALPEVNVLATKEDLGKVNWLIESCLSPREYCRLMHDATVKRYVSEKRKAVHFVRSALSDKAIRKLRAYWCLLVRLYRIRLRREGVLDWATASVFGEIDAWINIMRHIYDSILVDMYGVGIGNANPKMVDIVVLLRVPALEIVPEGASYSGKEITDDEILAVCGYKP